MPVNIYKLFSSRLFTIVSIALLYIAAVVLPAVYPIQSTHAVTSFGGNCFSEGGMEVCMNFYDGYQSGYRDMSIIDKMVEYVETAPAGSHLTMSFHTFDYNSGGGKSLADAIITKNNSSSKLGSVKLLTTFDFSTSSSRGPLRIEEADNENLVEIKNCNSAPCLPNDDGIMHPDATNHTKMFILERPGMDTVYSIGGANIRSWDEGGGTQDYNDAVFIKEQSGGAITSWMLEFFNKMWNGSWGDWGGSASNQAAKKVKSGGPLTNLGEKSVKTYAFQRDIDHWGAVLDNITDCDPDGDGVGGYVIVMNSSTWSGSNFDNVHDRLDELERPMLSSDPDRGCRVRVVAGDLNDTNSSEAPHSSPSFNLNNSRVAYNDKLHNKMLILKDVGYEGTSHTSQVFTGSYNMSSASRNYATELVIRIRNDALVNRYFEYAKTIWNDSTDLVSSAKPLTTSINGD